MSVILGFILSCVVSFNIDYGTGVLVCVAVKG